MQPTDRLCSVNNALDVHWPLQLLALPGPERPLGASPSAKSAEVLACSARQFRPSADVREVGTIFGAGRQPVCIYYKVIANLKVRWPEPKTSCLFAELRHVKSPPDVAFPDSIDTKPNPASADLGDTSAKNNIRRFLCYFYGNAGALAT